MFWSVPSLLVNLGRGESRLTFLVLRKKERLAQPYSIPEWKCLENSKLASYMAISWSHMAFPGKFYQHSANKNKTIFKV